MKRSLDHRISAVLIAIIGGAMGCASVPVVTSQQESFSTSQVEQIEVFPVLDGRRVINDRIDFERKVRRLPKQIARSLDRKGYECLDADDSANMAGLMPSQIPFASVDQVRGIGSGRARWVLLPIVENMAEVEGVKYNEIALYLFDRQAGKLAWEGSGSSPKDISISLNAVLKKFPGKKK